MKKTIMETLSRELSETEREAMFRKIRKDIVQAEINTEDVKVKAKDDKKRQDLIKNDMSRAGFWERFIVWMRSYMTGKSRVDVFTSRRLIALKRQIARRAPGVTGFETRNLTPKIAEAVFDIYRTSIILKETYTNLWIKEGNLEKAIVYLLINRLKKSRINLDDFISIEEMVQIYAAKGQKEKVRDEILKRLQDYNEDIGEEIYSDAEKELEPFYLMKEMVLFPYVAFFQLFGFNPAAMPEVKKPFFHNASAMLALSFLEKLYHAGMQNSLLDETIVIEPGTVKFIMNFSTAEEDPFKEVHDNLGPIADETGGSSSSDAGDGSAQSAEAEVPEILREEKINRYIADLNELHKKILRFSRNYPILDLLRFFHKDPYLMLNQKVTPLHFRDFHYMILKNAVLTKFNEIFPEIKRQSIQNEVDQLFKGKTIFTLQNYRMYTSIDYEKMGLPFFRHTRSINLLYNYIKAFYRSYFYDTFQLLDKSVLVGNRIIRDKLESASNSFEEIAQRIMEFDYSMSPDSEDGKLFQRLRFSMAGESSHQKMFRTLVLQKDREVKGLLERGDEDIEALIKVIQDLLSSPMQQIQSQLTTHYILRGKSVMLSTLLKSRQEHLLKFRGLLSQITKEERD